MTYRIICDDPLRLATFAREIGGWHSQAENCSAIGLEYNDKILAAVLYENYNGKSLGMHIAAVGKRWLTRDFLWYCFHYPFTELGCAVVFGVVPSDNLDARRFDEHLGFTHVYTMDGAAPGGDLLLYEMRRDKCRWLDRSALNGKAQRPTSTRLRSGSYCNWTV